MNELTDEDLAALDEIERRAIALYERAEAVRSDFDARRAAIEADLEHAVAAAAQRRCATIDR